MLSGGKKYAILARLHPVHRDRRVVLLRRTICPQRVRSSSGEAPRRSRVIGRIDLAAEHRPRSGSSGPPRPLTCTTHGARSPAFPSRPHRGQPRTTGVAGGGQFSSGTSPVRSSLHPASKDRRSPRQPDELATQIAPLRAAAARGGDATDRSTGENGIAAGGSGGRAISAWGMMAVPERRARARELGCGLGVERWSSRTNERPTRSPDASSSFGTWAYRRHSGQRPRCTPRPTGRTRPGRSTPSTAVLPVEGRGRSHQAPELDRTSGRTEPR